MSSFIGTSGVPPPPTSAELRLDFSMEAKPVAKRFIHCGDSALQEALTLAPHVSNITLVTDGDTLTAQPAYADPVMAEEVRSLGASITLRFGRAQRLIAGGRDQPVRNWVGSNDRCSNSRFRLRHDLINLSLVFAGYDRRLRTLPHLRK